MGSAQQARQELESAHRKAMFNTILLALKGEDNHLIPFDWVHHLHPQGEHYVGTQTILVDAIMGSVDRYADFDQHFLPRESHLDQRWIRVRQAQLEGSELPPIQVYKVGDLYFVKDGNHRVSVAKKNKQIYIDAEVIELDVLVLPTAQDDQRKWIIKGEAAEFLKVTHLERLRPDHEEILFSVPGRFDFLLEHIYTRQYFLSQNQNREVTFEEAVISWYDALYCRIVQQVRNHHVLTRFPGRTEADLYLWIMNHRYFLSEKYGHDVGSERSTKDFVAHYAPHWYHRMGRILLDWWKKRH